VADFGGGLMSRRLPAAVILFGQQLAGAAIVGAVVVAAMEAPPSQRGLILSVLAGATGALALGVFYKALAVGTMSIVAPISATGVTLPVVVGLATGDRPSALQAVGLAVTAAGVVLASREVGIDAPASARRAIPLALVAALGFGTYFTLSDGAADESVLWLLLAGRATAVVLLGLLLATRARRDARLPGRRDLLLIAGIGAMDLAATGLYGVANTHGPLSIVAIVGAIYPVTTVLLARVVLRERLQRSQAVGVALAFAGVAAVAGG
jgi:drug/metabolite transporter (DMT)-like permease